MDVYVFLGDYIYERRRVVAGDVRADRIHANDLPSYRAKYQLYRSDAGLRELHRVHPAVHIWDDHEIANNYSERAREPALMQRTAGYRAALEWLPRQVPRNDRFRIYRRFHVGAQVEVFLLDTRQYRTPAVAGGPRRILDETQMRWLISGLQRSTATWKVVAQQVTIAASPTGRPSRDDWDGYPEDRARLLGAIEAAGIPNVLFLTGDAHVFACNHLASDFTALGDTGARPSAVEYVGGSVTSPGTIRDEAVVRANSPWVQEYNAAEHGYAYLTLDAAQAVTEYRRSDLSSPSGATATFERFTQPAGANRVARESFLV
jgi:phosphodiesterase/alkaline phosphatase D-like protein